MKRRKEYMPRSGMKFDRKRKNEPSAGFIGSEITDVVEITGSVERSLTSQDGDFTRQTIPLIGFPRTAAEMGEAAGGFGVWKEGYIFDNSTAVGVSGVFSSGVSNALNATNNIGISYYDVPGPILNDRAVFINNASVTGSAFIKNNTTDYNTSGDLIFLWVARSDSDSIVGQKHIFGRTTEGVTGYRTYYTGSSISFATADGGSFGTSRLFTAGNWHIGLLAMQNRFVNAPGDESWADASILATKDLVTGEIASSSVNSLFFPFVAEPVSANFTLGGEAYSLGVDDFSIAAFYGGASVSASVGCVENYEKILNSFAATITGKSNWLFTGTLGTERSLSSFGSLTETNNLNHNLLGLGTGSSGYKRGLVSPVTSSIPSWSNRHLGQNSSFVIPTLSSSNHESQVLGLRLSGSERLEAGSGSAEVNSYYSRSTGYQYVTVKKTASYLDTTRLPAGMDGSTPIYFDAAKGTDVTSLTGSLSYITGSIGAAVKAFQQSSTQLNPCFIPIEVPYSGKIVDIKVWVELSQTSGSGVTSGKYPLGNLSISLRSPNVKWGHAIPIRNDPALKKVLTTNLSDFSGYGSFGQLGQSLFGPNFISPFYQDTFILWEGGGLIGEQSTGPWDTDTEGGGGGAQYATNKYPTWQRDRSMRTIFSDGSPIPNPRHHKTNGLSPATNYDGSPNSYFGINNAFGMDVPWTSQTEVSGASTYALAGSPPAGWLSGLGGANAVNEWPTTGVNYGAETLKPLYPLLDPIFQRKRYGSDITRRSEVAGTVFNTEEWTGFRPGLRGTEVSGTWYLMIGALQSTLGDITSPPDSYVPTFFKQVRLEFVLSDFADDTGLRRNSSRYIAKKSSNQELVVSVSGSDALYDATGGWDAYISDTYLLQNDNSSPWEIGRTMGIVELTGNLSTAQQFALAYRITGTIADLSGSSPGWLTNNRFAMPSIPVSSASLAEPDAQEITSVNPQTILTARSIVDGTKRISDAAQDANPPRTRFSYAAIVTSGST